MKFLFIVFLLFPLFSFAQGPPNEEHERVAKAKKQLDEEGGGALTAFGGGMMNAMGPPVPMISYEGHLIPDNGNNNKQMENRFNLTAPVYQADGRSLSINLTGGKLDFSGPITLDSGKVIAGEWTRMEIGLQYSEQLSAGKNWSVRAAAGYSGDDPAHYTKDDSYSFIGTYGFPGTGTDFWAVFVFLANNSQLANYVPFPGFVYIHRTEHFTGAFGLPILSLQWTPDKNWILSASIFGLNAQAEAAFGNVRIVQAFIGYAYAEQSYIPSVRDNETDRLFVREQKVGPGLRKVIGKKLLIEAQGGWSFNRAVYVSDSVFKMNSVPYAQLDDGWFGNLVIKYAF